MSDVDYTDRVFWKVYTYACSGGCGWEREFYLEASLGGRPDERLFVGLPKSFEMEKRRDIANRPVLPVPFVAAGCPNCQPGGPPFRMAEPSLQHVRWQEDRVLRDPIIGKPQRSGGGGPAPHFIYPDDPHADRACGHPVIPGYFEPDP